jgi:hypothetical protein
MRNRNNEASVRRAHRLAPVDFPFAIVHEKTLVFLVADHSDFVP